VVINVDKYLEPSEITAITGGFAVAPVSWSPEVVQDISGPPTLGALAASSIASHDHADAVTSGLKFEFTVPDDYDSGDITLSAVYAMSTAVPSPNNIIVLSIGAEIANTITGAIDTATYAPGPIALTTPDNLTDVTRSTTILTIAAADFGPGDKIVFLIERLGSDAGDLHTGVWQLVDYMVTYDGQVASRAAVHQVEVFSDTGGTPAVAGTKSSFDTLDFQEGFTHEQKVQFTIPDNWDGSSDLHVQITYAMSTAVAADVRLNFSGNVSSVTTGAVTALLGATFVVTATADTDVHRTTVVYAVSGIGRTAGDTIALAVSRPSGDALDTHTGNFQLIALTVLVGQSGTTPVTSEISEGYLPHRNFNIITVAGVDGEQESPAYAGDFELWTLMTSTVAAGRVDVEFQGRLRETQSKISRIIIPIKGQSGGPTPQYQVKIYAEGSGIVPVHTGVLTAETTGLRSLITLTDVNLSAQPNGERRFFVVVEATLDAGEELRVGTPFVRQE
jgi:hypothetical protein